CHLWGRSESATESLGCVRLSGRLEAHWLRRQLLAVDRRRRGHRPRALRPSLDVGLRLDRRLRDDLVDDVVPETARGQEGVDLALPLAGFERFPAPQLARDRASRSV